MSRLHTEISVHGAGRAPAVWRAGLRRLAVGPLLPAGLLATCLLWSYAPTLADLSAVWRTDDDYSVGALVPLVAIYLVWRERAALRATILRSHWAGGVLLLGSQLLRFAGVYCAYGSAERLSFSVALAGLILLIGGYGLFRRLLWVQIFLLLMFPLPRRVHELVATPLQQGAIAAACFGLELLDVYVRRDGNVLNLGGDHPVMVSEACSGLRMLTAFVFIAAVVALAVRRPAWEKAVILLSSLPIAVFANGVRVLTTALVIWRTQNDAIEQRFHDLAGVLMMPLGLLMLFGELKFLDRLSTPARSRLPAEKATTGLAGGASV